MGTTSGRLGVTTYNAGDTAWSHTSGLETIDTNITNILKGKVFADAVSSTASAVNLTSLDAKGVGLLEFGSASGGNDLTTITNGTNEQFLFVRFTNASPADVIHGTGTDAITLQDATDWTPSQHDFIILWYDGDNNIWREVVRSAASGYVAASSVDRTALKTTTVNVGSISNGSSTTVSQVAGGWALAAHSADAGGASLTWVGNGVGTAELAASGANATNVTVRYIQASPPWYVGGEEWGSFAYVLRDTSTGEILNYLFAQDPMWYLGGMSVWDKNSPERIAEAPPHPFWFGDDWATRTRVPPPGQEVVLVDLREIDLAEDEFCLRKKRAEKYREMAAAKAAQGRPLAEVLELAGKADTEDAKTNPVKGKAYLLRDKHATADGRTAWSYVADTPQLLNATSQAKKKGKPIKFGVKEVDDLVTIVSAG